MKRFFVYLPLVLVFSVTASLMWSQAAKTHKSARQVDTSKAHAWAEAVTDFITERRMLENFRTEDVGERFKALVPPEALIVLRPNAEFRAYGMSAESGESLLGNPEKGVLQLYYELSQEGKGMSQIDSLRIYMPRTDPDGVDVLSRVVSSLKRKLRPPWVAVHHSPYPYFWDEKEKLLSVTAEVVDKLPDRRDGREPNGRFISGSWVFVTFGHVEEPEYVHGTGF